MENYTLSIALILAALALTACGQAPSQGVVDSLSPRSSIPTSVPDSQAGTTTKVDPPVVSPTCKPLLSSWQTAMLNLDHEPWPQSILLGQYIGVVSTNGPRYTLDLTPTGDLVGLYGDAYNRCNYGIEVSATSYRLTRLVSCTAGIEGDVDCTQYNCPLIYGRVFNYTLTCDTLTVTDTVSGQRFQYQ